MGANWRDCKGASPTFDRHTAAMWSSLRGAQFVVVAGQHRRLATGKNLGTESRENLPRAHFNKKDHALVGKPANLFAPWRRFDKLRDKAHANLGRLGDISRADAAQNRYPGRRHRQIRERGGKRLLGRRHQRCVVGAWHIEPLGSDSPLPQYGEHSIDRRLRPTQASLLGTIAMRDAYFAMMLGG